MSSVLKKADKLNLSLSLSPQGQAHVTWEQAGKLNFWALAQTG